jgi:NADH-quinone oxidoreductase subunit L
MHAMANEGNVWKMGGLRKVMPITFWTSAVAWLAISGVPPFAGFFSKDQILTTAYENGFTGIWVVGVLVAVLTAFYMTRWFLLIFMGDKRFSSDVHPHESPTSMTFPLLVLGALSLVGGAVLNLTHHGPFYRWLQPAVASTEGLAFAEHGALTEPALIAISVVAALVGIGASWAVYGRRDLSAGAIAEPIRGPIAELMQRKFFVDELYEAVFVRFGGWLANGMVWFDTNVIDGLVNGAGAASTATARRVRRVQTGLVRGYLAGMVAGAVILLAVLLVQVR